MHTEKEIAGYLLECKAIKLQPSKPFRWASGWNSPIYCDNRVTLSYPAVRSAIRDSFVALIKEKFPQANKIAGVATGAIAQGALVADAMQLPFIYVRAAPKDHGLTNLIEGEIGPSDRIVVIEDLISTGGSSLKAVEAIRAEGVEVLGMAAIFTYGFEKAENAFAANLCTLHTLSNYNALVEKALETGYIEPGMLETLKTWRVNPGTWGL